MRYAFIEARKALYPVRVLCRLLEVVPSGFYAWRRRSPSEHQRRDVELAVRIAAVHYEHKKRYGSPQVHGELKKQGERVSRKRVARIMREQSLSAKPLKRFRRTTDSSHNLPVAKNILGRNFTAQGPDRVWVTDITYVRTWEGWLYVAVVLDLFSRRVVGWAIADRIFGRSA